MKRLIEFKYQNEEYILEETGAIVFGIKTSDLKFNSLKFYNGVYKGKSPNIELENKLGPDPHKKGSYIFSWLSDIVSSIRNEFPNLLEEDAEGNTEDIPSEKLIPLFEFAACAGDGFFIDENIPHIDISDPTGEADFAVTVSGDSMEPTIEDKSIIYVKDAEELQHNDIGLFIINNEVMCKRYTKHGRGIKLVPDNSKYGSISKKDVYSFKILGRVLV